MNVLIGIPEETHLEIGLFEVDGLKMIGVDVETIIYGPRPGKGNIFAKCFVMINTALKMRAMLKEHSVEIVYLNTAFARNALVRDLITLFIIKSYKGKVFLKFHGSNSHLLRSKNPIQSHFIKRLSELVDGFGVLSKEEKSNFIKANFSKNKLYLVKNIVRKKAYVPDENFAKRFSIDKNTPIILFIARFIRSKGLLDVIRAISIVNKAGYRFRLLCVGDGPDAIHAKREVEKYGLSSKIIFTGFVPEKETKQFYANSTMLVFPTYHEEGFPMAVFQSLSAGLPIVTTRIRAARDYLKEPDNCLWVEPKNPRMLAEKIGLLLKSPELMNVMRKNNRELANKFSSETVSNELFHNFKGLLGYM